MNIIVLKYNKLIMSTLKKYIFSKTNCVLLMFVLILHKYVNKYMLLSLV